MAATNGAAIAPAGAATICAIDRRGMEEDAVEDVDAEEDAVEDEGADEDEDAGVIGLGKTEARRGAGVRAAEAAAAAAASAAAATSSKLTLAPCSTRDWKSGESSPMCAGGEVSRRVDSFSGGGAFLFFFFCSFLLSHK